MSDEKDENDKDDKDEIIKNLEDELRRTEANNARQRAYARKLEHENRDMKKTIKSSDDEHVNGNEKNAYRPPPEKPESW